MKFWMKIILILLIEDKTEINGIWKHFFRNSSSFFYSNVIGKKENTTILQQAVAKLENDIISPQAVAKSKTAIGKRAVSQLENTENQQYLI